MTGLVEIELFGSPPAWATGRRSGFFSYFENRHGEQWIARLEGKDLVFAGLDIGWCEIRLTAREARAFLDLQLQGQVAGHRVHVVHDTLVDPSEALWMAAVIRAALPQMGG